MKITKPINLLLSAVVGMSFACGGEKTSESVSEPKEDTTIVKTPTTPQEKAPAPETGESQAPATSEQAPVNEKFNDSDVSIRGLAKVEASDCSSCHAVEDKIIGPAFLDIAMEYENNEKNINLLASKVIEGGAGVWGDYAMPPHNGLSEQDAKDMVAYILKLK